MTLLGWERDGVLVEGGLWDGALSEADIFRHYEGEMPRPDLLVLYEPSSERWHGGMYHVVIRDS